MEGRLYQICAVKISEIAEYKVDFILVGDMFQVLDNKARHFCSWKF